MTTRPCQAANPDNCRWPEHQKQHNATRAYANARVDYAEVCFSENPAPEDYLRVTTTLHEARIKFDATDDGQKQLKDKLKKAADSGDEKTLKTYSDRSIKADAYLNEEAEVNKKVSAATSEKEKEERRNIYLTGEERRGLGRLYADEIAEERFEEQLKAKVASKREAAEDAAFVAGITITDEIATELNDRKVRRAARIESFEAGKLQEQASLQKVNKVKRTVTSEDVAPQVQPSPARPVEPELSEDTKTERRKIYLTSTENRLLPKLYADAIAEDRHIEQQETMKRNAEEKAKPKSIADKIQNMFRTPKKSTPAPPAG